MLGCCVADAAEFRSRTVLGRRARAIAVGDTLGDLLIPLLLRLAVEETNNAHGHVVAADATSLGVGGKAVVHHVLADLVQVLLGCNSTADKLNNSLRGLAVPDTITGQNKELVLIGEVVLFNVGKGGDNLVLGGELGALLEFEVTNGAGQGQIAVDTAKVDKAASRCDSALLACILLALVPKTSNMICLTLHLGLVVNRQGFSSALNTEYTPRVTSVGLLRVSEAKSDREGLFRCYIQRRACCRRSS